jgi:hypothetical protein
MRKSVIIMLLGAAFVWGCTMLVHAEDAPKAPEHWKIVIGVHPPDGENLEFVYGSREKGPVYYGSEAECKKASGGDRKFLEALKKILEFAKEHRTTVDKPVCILEVKPNEL